MIWARMKNHRISKGKDLITLRSGVGSGEWGVGSGEWGVGSGEWGVAYKGKRYA